MQPIQISEGLSSGSERYCEPAAYHDDGRVGYFSMLWDDGQRKRQRCYPLGSMHLALANVDLTRDAWVSQAEFFRPSRRIVHFSRVSVCFADLDTYKVPELAGWSVSSQLRRLLEHCKAEWVPEPSLVVFSGRGLQVKWVLETPVPTAGLPRWKAVQIELTRRLAKLGSDRASIDAARVLRLVSSTNSKSGEIVRVLHYSDTRFGFDALAETLLPRPRSDRAGRTGPNEPGEPFPRPPRTRGAYERDKAANDPHYRLVGAQLAWDRLGDLRRLASLRGWTQGAPDNWRDRCVFLGACFLAQAVPDIRRLDLEIYALAREFAPRWTAIRAADSTQAALRRARRAAAGEKDEYLGRNVDPRYRFKNATLIEWLEITDAEQRQLTTIIARSEAQRRDTSRASQKRREAGVLERDVYLAIAEQRGREAHRLRIEGTSWAQVASAVGYASAKSAQVSVANWSKTRNKSVAMYGVAEPRSVVPNENFDLSLDG